MKKTYTVDGMVVAVNLATNPFDPNQTLENFIERLRDIQQEMADEMDENTDWLLDSDAEAHIHGPDPYINHDENKVLAVLLWKEFEFTDQGNLKAFVGHLNEYEYETEGGA